METVHKVSWLAATYYPHLPGTFMPVADIFCFFRLTIKRYHVGFVPLTVAGQRRIFTGFLYWRSYVSAACGFSCPRAFIYHDFVACQANLLVL